MSDWNDLLRFASAHQDELTLSVYVAASPADPTTRHSWMVLLRQHLHAAQHDLANASDEEQSAFGRCVERLFDQLPAQRTFPRGASWAFFAGAGGDELILALPPGADTAVHWGLGPLISESATRAARVARVD